MTGAERGAAAGFPPGAAAARVAGVGGAGARAAAGAGGAGAAVTATGAAAAAGAVEAGAGILIVGAAVGFGGKLIRTVSFLGCTFAASVGLGGTAPDGVFGMFSAINVFQIKARVGASWCQMLIRGKLVAKENGPEENRPAEYRPGTFH